MLLRKLEAYGFKSFAEKTEIEFKSGITAIVGPNGSGKSNISDAVRWVLGEQNIRNLRGARMEDVIFSGTAKRRPLGVAEVSLFFDNTDGTLPLDFNEVTITRRVFRSGEGEFFINKSPCRLKDIYDLLIDAGLGRESMTVISQNKVDEVLNSKPDERRLLFEEAAGITKYKNRKKEAMRKLDDTEQNLTRVFDITSEIETQLGPLGESAERTAQYNALAAEQTACEVTLLSHKLTQAEKNAESVRLEQASIADEDVAAASHLVLAETDRERLTDELAALDETARQAETAIVSLATEMERLDGKAAVLAERVGQEQRTKERTRQDVVRLEADREENRGKLAEWQEALSAKKQQVLELQAAHSAKNAGYQEALRTIGEAEGRIEQAKDATFGHLQELVTQKNTLRTMERDRENHKHRETQLSKEYDTYDAQAREAGAALARVEGEQRELAEDLKAVDALIAETVERRQALERRLGEMANAESRLSGKISEHRSRMKVLLDMQNEYEGFGRGPKSVLRANAGWRKAVCGAVAEVISVRDEHVVAVETALGGALQNIIVENDDTAKAAVEYLKNRQLGRATFLPLNTVKPMRPRDTEAAAAHSPGAVGFAAELVSCDDKFRPAVDFLLARTVVAADMDAALKIARQSGFGVKIVTLDGQLIQPGGSITGGSVARREASFLGRGNEITVTGEALKALESELAALRERAGAADRAKAAVLAELENSQTRRQGVEVRQAELSILAEKAGQELNRQRLALATLESEREDLRRESAALVDRMAETTGLIAVLEARDAEHKLQITAWQEDLKRLQERRDSLAESLTDAKIKLSALEQEVHSITLNCENYRQAESRFTRQAAALEAEIARADEEIARAGAELAGIAVRKDELTGQKAEQEKRRDTLMGDKLNVMARQQKLDREIRELRRKQAAIQNRLHELELLAARFTYDISYADEQLRDRFGMNREQAEALFRDEAPEVLTARVEELEAAIALLGPVNPAAIDEYARLKERYEFLRGQYQDLTAAREYLMTIIKDIDSTMSKQFKAAFLKINEHFGELFIRLFGGGKAELQLADPDDILGTGIEIIVQPPGKKQQNLALLSGGERALTVIALLFAFLTYRPTPFCVLDEIDAALDEANVQRFSEFLRDYSESTQFIIVTHRKGTMEVADVMHGVTMEESGVSKLISVKFMDKAG
ncbi:MAG TPA: chromosome segregation protein SMC [Selenomonadales bacterium]|nr:chromosome segregation protein SMC [Selenomonadales bacterium]